jgi:glucose-6-phosphate dehydrogenase assembly protein OpcA
MSPQAVSDDLLTRHVDPGAIEREIRSLWREQGENRQKVAPNERPVGRTLLHTLVVFAADDATAKQARQVTAALNPHQPGRTILLVGPPAGEAPADDQDIAASVALHCVAPGEGQDVVCCEHVTLTAPNPAAVRRLPGTILPLLLTDVPSFLYWMTGNPFRHPILKDLAPAIDRLIIDSFAFAAPEPDLADVASALKDRRFHAIISDMSWARLAVWRYQTAQLFDAAQMRPYLNRIKHVHLSYYAGTPVLAWLFSGWLASRLGWRPIDRQPQAVRFADGQTMEYASLALSPVGQPGYFAGVSLAADDGTTFEVARRGTGFTATRVTVGDLTTERVVRLRDETTTEWLGHELGRLSATPTYEAALRILVDAAAAGAAYVG